MVDIEKLAAKAREGLPAKEKKAEPKDAAPAPSAETQKTKEEPKKVEEPKAKEPEVKKEAAPEKKAESKTKEEKMELRIHELVDKVGRLEKSDTATKAEIESAKTERDLAKNELSEIKKQLSMTPEDKLKDKVKLEVSSRLKKHLEEDKSKPREEKREMAKEELDEWLLEDFDAASEWKTRRDIRRYEDEKYVKHDVVMTERARVIQAKQKESADRVAKKHPELDIENRRLELLKEGKSRPEIRTILMQENPKFKLAMEILEANPDKYVLAENGPELIVEELEKRLSSKPEVDTEKEELKARLERLEAENETLKNLDNGVESTRHGNSPSQEETEISKKQEEISRKLGLDPKRIKARVEERKKQGYDG